MIPTHKDHYSLKYEEQKVNLPMLLRIIHIHIHILVSTVRDALQTLRDGVPTQKYPV